MNFLFLGGWRSGAISRGHGDQTAETAVACAAEARPLSCLPDPRAQRAAPEHANLRNVRQFKVRNGQHEGRIARGPP